MVILEKNWNGIMNECKVVYKEIDSKTSDKFLKNHPWFGKNIFSETIKHVFNNSWIESVTELPPNDGIYEVTNSISNEFDLGCCEYNGFGFNYDSHYVYPLFWRHIEKKQKRYGKINQL